MENPSYRWHYLDTADDVARQAAAHVLQAALEAVAERGRFRLVLAGGATPEKVYRLLAEARADWSKWHVYFGDERCLPPDHPDRNSLMASKAFLASVAIPAGQIYDIPAELGSELGAEKYRAVVAEALPFDMVLLGMGEDGHTASLFPGRVHDADALTHAVHDSPKPPPERVSVSARALGDTRSLVFLITGKSKREAVQAWRAGADLPVAAVMAATGADVYIDREALPSAQGGENDDRRPPAR